MGFINKIFGTHSQHELKRIKPIVDKKHTYPNFPVPHEPGFL